MFDTLRELNRKLDEVVGRQERTLSLVSAQQAGIVQQGQVPPGQVPPPPMGANLDTIRRHEVDSLFNNQNQILSTARELRQFVTELKNRVDTVINNQARQPTAQVQSVGYDMQSLISEMRDGLNHVKQNYGQVMQKLAEKQNCPTTNCVSVTMLLGITVVQLAVLLGYLIYR